MIWVSTVCWVLVGADSGSGGSLHAKHHADVWEFAFFLVARTDFVPCGCASFR